VRKIYAVAAIAEVMAKSADTTRSPTRSCETLALTGRESSAE
jgi:hypothetical protein